MAWTKEEQEKYKARRKPFIKLQLSEKDLYDLYWLFDWLKTRPVPTRHNFNNDIVEKTYMRLKKAQERLVRRILHERG